MKKMGFLFERGSRFFFVLLEMGNEMNHEASTLLLLSLLNVFYFDFAPNFPKLKFYPQNFSSPFNWPRFLISLEI